MKFFFGDQVGLWTIWGIWWNGWFFGFSKAQREAYLTDTQGRILFGK